MSNESNKLRRRIQRRLNWIESGEYQKAITARQLVTAITPKFAMMLEDKSFIAVVRLSGTHSIPNIKSFLSCASGDAERPGVLSQFGRYVLAFAVLWQFITRVRSASVVSAYIEGAWPGLLTELDGVAAALMEYGFFAGTCDSPRRIGPVTVAVGPIGLDNEMHGSGGWFSPLY